MVKRLAAMWETQVQSLGQEDPLEKEMATHSSTVAWKIPWMEEPDGLQSQGSLSWTQLSDFAFLSLDCTEVEAAATPPAFPLSFPGCQTHIRG